MRGFEPRPPHVNTLMRRVEIRRFGGPEVLEIVQCPVPAPGPGEVVVAMVAAGVNPVDYKMRDGSSRFVQQEQHFPLVPGREGFGTVHAIGPGVDRFRVGQFVWGIPQMGWQTGTHTEFAAFAAPNLVPAPAGIDPLVLGGTPMAALTAWTAAFDLGRVDESDVVLIHGAGGAVGFWMVQLCLRAGATVYASASTRHQDRLRAAGAIALDYTTGDVLAGLPPIDVVLDAVYLGTFAPSLDVLRPGGRIVAVPTLADISEALARGFDAHVALTTSDPRRLTQVGALLASGAVSAEVAGVFALDDLAEAHQILQSGHAPGKLVVDFTR